MGRRCSRGSLDVQYNPMETLCKLFCITCRGTTVHAEPMANVHRLDGYSCSLLLPATVVAERVLPLMAGKDTGAV